MIFNIEDNPALKGEEPLYRAHEPGYRVVKQYDAVIDREARRFGVDPDLVRAVLYIENADGHRLGLDRLSQESGHADTLLPMNINPEFWGGLGGISKGEFSDPEKNIRAGVAFLKEIKERIENPTPAKIASIWQFTGSENVRSYGVRVERAMREKLWEIPPEEEMPRPHVP